MLKSTLEGAGKGTRYLVAKDKNLAKGVLVLEEKKVSLNDLKYWCIQDISL